MKYKERQHGTPPRKRIIGISLEACIRDGNSYPGNKGSRNFDKEQPTRFYFAKVLSSHPLKSIASRQYDTSLEFRTSF